MMPEQPVAVEPVPAPAPVVTQDVAQTAYAELEAPEWGIDDFNTSTVDGQAKIRAFLDGWNDRSHPFVWTKTADEILNKANRPTTSNPRH